MLFALSISPAAATDTGKVTPQFWTTLGATVYNDTSGGIGIGHWWTDAGNYDTVLRPGMWSDSYYQNCQKVYVGSGYGYGLYKQVSNNSKSIWVPVSAGRGPVKLHLTDWVRYKIRTWR